MGWRISLPAGTGRTRAATAAQHPRCRWCPRRSRRSVRFICVTAASGMNVRTPAALQAQVKTVSSDASRSAAKGPKCFQTSLWTASEHVAPCHTVSRRRLGWRERNSRRYCAVPTALRGVPFSTDPAAQTPADAPVVMAESQPAVGSVSASVNARTSPSARVAPRFRASEGLNRGECVTTVTEGSSGSEQ